MEHNGDEPHDGKVPDQLREEPVPEEVPGPAEAEAAGHELVAKSEQRDVHPRENAHIEGELQPHQLSFRLREHHLGGEFYQKIS